MRGTRNNQKGIYVYHFRQQTYGFHMTSTHIDVERHANARHNTPNTPEWTVG
eukprot:m.371015 g.371015  ORF g.371015 m.371015 type:complete len:52 (+) comp56683_c0_seq1:178-333(+)